MGAFEIMGTMDAQHRAERGIDPGRLLTGRAAELADALIPMNRVRPVLRSRHLVKGWLDRGAMSVVYGESNVGKTFFALDLAAHVAAGLDWHGHRVPSGEKWAGPVLYIASEGGTGIRNRMEAMRRENPDLDGDKLILLPAGLDLCTSDDSQWLVETILTKLPQRPSLIVVDTLARAMGNGDENTAQDMGQFVRSIDHLRAETGAHVMVIHHSGKDASKGARGSGSLRAAADTEIELTRSDDTIMAEQRKQRDMPCDGVFAYTLKSVFLGLDDEGDRVTSAVVTPAEAVTRKNKVRLTGTDKIGMQALSDALAHHGEVRQGDMFPRSRQCVSLDRWREFCDRHSLSSGEGDSSKRTAFHKLKNRLQDKEIVRIVDGFVWKVEPDDKRSHRSQTVPENAGNVGHAAVPTVPALYKSGNEGTLTQPGKEVVPDLGENPAPSTDTTLPQTGARIPLPDPDTFDPEMWR
ncbi:AAA family ATPase [Paracoccus chinensis]|uniref:AAA domain-containing protein n=1 Tax=Paracoccus chinensis TaxID=525640 RepID=A0A1G9DEG7_9RHOB|nr:helicase RepA family protein [Paracoccus chinensis]SDK62262.1 AAA domain-containing protein [Paracoccus chinensis]